MNPSRPLQGHWQERLRQQRLNNARVWLEKLNSKEDIAELATEEYGNLLRALETAVADPGTFELAFNLIEALFPFAFNFGDWERWLHYLEQALQQSQTMRHQRASARLYSQMGDLQRHIGQTANAEMSYQQAHSQYQALSESSSQAHMLVKIGGLFGGQGRLIECQAIREQVEGLRPMVTDPTLRPLVHLGLSLLYTFETDWPHVLAEAELAAELFRQQGNTAHEVRALNNMALAHMQLGNWRDAEPILARLTQILTTSEDYVTLSSVKNNLGIIAFEQQAYHQAEAYWHEALLLQSQIKDREQKSLLLNNLGVVYTRLGEWAEARKLLDEAAQHYQKMGDWLSWANVVDNLADLHEAQGDQAASITALEQIRAMFADMDLDDGRYATVFDNASERLKMLQARS